MAAPWDHLAAADADIGAVLAEIGPPPPRDRAPGLDALIGIVMDQQISKAAGAAIKARLDAHWRTPSPAAIDATSDVAFQAIGLSRPKIATLRALAAAIGSGSLDLGSLATMPEPDAFKQLTAVKGIGRWTAEIYLMFALGRHDVWPAQDLALQNAMQAAKRLDSRPDVKRMDLLGEPLRPHRSAAALLLWRYHRHLRGIDLALP
ncbi:MAG: DNA-3-methyladenine glycosylase 2 family protein [Alphaproteobacteria bacterium]|nr:DNA-3-methyladenine glycosylase 2 family protein [Alphaproteobacteria bacterium]